MNEVTAVRLGSVGAFARGITKCVAENISEQSSDLLMHRARAEHAKCRYACLKTAQFADLRTGRVLFSCTWEGAPARAEPR